MSEEPYCYHCKRTKYDVDAQMFACQMPVCENELASLCGERDRYKAERDRLTVLAELVWQSKSLLEAHQHFVAWRDRTGEFSQDTPKA